LSTPKGFPDILNLTELELVALDSGVNVADGHARHEPTASQQKIIGRLPELFGQAAETPVAVVDREAQQAFLSSVGQRTAITASEVLSCYSSSVAMEIFSTALRTAGVKRVALIHPTFDNISDILRRSGMSLIPVSEEYLLQEHADLPDGAEVLFITTPNNPTGWILPREVLARWARICAVRGVILALDTSFRGFDERSQYDHVAVLAEAGCRYVIIEDSGKLWPVLDLKLGFLVFAPGDPLPLRKVYTEILLGVSPLILLLVRNLAEDAGEGGFAELHRLVAANRSLVRALLAGAGLHCPDPGSRISVERIALPPGISGTRMCRALAAQGVHVLPGRQFYWADPQAGERFVRVALSRQADGLTAAAEAIAGYLGPRALGPRALGH
jgi:enduracididine biosynthesis enzyme MppP